jgi:Family of unknown function (DUF6529)
VTATPDQTGESRESTAVITALLVPLVVGTAVAVALGVFARVHDPTGHAIDVPGFKSTLSVKTWLTTVAALLAIVQVVTASGMWGRLGLGDATWTAPVHRWTGRLAVAATIPVVVHCVYAIGFESTSTRVLLHSVLGCFFFGAFVAKMLALPRGNLPGWALPVLGGLVTIGLIALWLSSALWYFDTHGIGT